MKSKIIMLASGAWEAPVILFSLLAFFGLIVVAVIIAKKNIKGLQNKDDQPIDEEKAIEEELNRILEPIEDEEIKAQMLKSQDKEPKDDEQN
ncbi:MAG: hypothetical protein WCZ47_02950 [Bacilli bacterium]|jgi:membrane protein implicated in regulation of membrane protease activity|nr:hypothetical protein [Bacilli bacterium]NLN80224.1 hypothetical protein [Erysipelotrichia bacterium]